jgi:hypothetical protein
MKKQTIEEFINSQPYYGSCTIEYKEGIEVGAKWQAERMYLLHDIWENHVREHFHPEFSSISFKGFVENYNKEHNL